MANDTSAVSRLEGLGEQFSEALQARFDWIDAVMPHPPGHVKLTEAQQVRLFEQRMADPSQIDALIQREGSGEVRKYIEHMTKVRNQRATS